MKSKPDYWYKQSCVIPFRYNDNILQLLLITSRKRKRWIFPKGIIEPDLSSQESAMKEALEEAGIEGELFDEKIGKYKYKKWGSKCRVNVYGLKVTIVHDKWEEDFRDRKWVKYDEIEKYISDEKFNKIVLNLVEMIKN